jgi:hypothetical protein
MTNPLPRLCNDEIGGKDSFLLNEGPVGHSDRPEDMIMFKNSGSRFDSKNHILNTNNFYEFERMDNISETEDHPDFTPQNNARHAINLTHAGFPVNPNIFTPGHNIDLNTLNYAGLDATHKFGQTKPRTQNLDIIRLNPENSSVLKTDGTPGSLRIVINKNSTNSQFVNFSNNEKNIDEIMASINSKNLNQANLGSNKKKKKGSGGVNPKTSVNSENYAAKFGNTSSPSNEENSMSNSKILFLLLKIQSETWFRDFWPGR